MAHWLPGSMTLRPACCTPCSSQSGSQLAWFLWPQEETRPPSWQALHLGDRQPDKGMEKGKPQAVFVFLSDT